MEDMVKAARTLDQNWHMFAGPQRSGQCHNIRVVEGQPIEEINAFQNKSKKQGKLSPEERKCRIDNNLCLYCGKAGHQACECQAPLNKFPKPPIRHIETIPEEDKQVDKPDAEINVLDSNQFALLATIDSEEMNVSSDF
jgi:hypothetical protein